MVNRNIELDCIHTWAAGRRSWRRTPGPCCPWSCRRPSPPPGASPGCGRRRMRGTCYPRTPPARAGSRMWGLNRVISWRWSLKPPDPDLTWLGVPGLGLAVRPQPNVHQWPDLLHGGHQVVEDKIPATSNANECFPSLVLVTSPSPGVRTEALVVQIHRDRGVRGRGGHQEGGDGHHGVPGPPGWAGLGDVSVAVEDPDYQHRSDTAAKLEWLCDLGMNQVQAQEELFSYNFYLYSGWQTNHFMDLDGFVGSVCSFISMFLSLKIHSFGHITKLLQQIHVSMIVTIFVLNDMDSFFSLSLTLQVL